MPTPHHPPVEVTRRVVVTGVVLAAGAVAAGCTSGSDETGRPKPSRVAGKSARHDPDVALAAQALAGEQSALEALEATLARHRGLRRTLSPMIEAHRAHLSLLAQAAPEGSPAPETPSPSDPTTGPFRVPDSADTAIRRLSALEQGLSTSGRRHSFAAESGGFARLLASMAAASAQHVALLGPAALSRGSSRGSSDGAPS